MAPEAPEHTDGTLNTDGWGNLLTGLGMQAHDKKTRATYLSDAHVDQKELADLYRTDGFARKVIDRPVYDMLRESFEVKNDTDQAILEYMDTFKWKKQVSTLLKWDRLYGGSLIILGAQDGQKLDQPLNVKNLRTIEFLRVVDVYHYDRTKDVDKDSESKRYGLPVTYLINPGDASKEYTVHHSRVFEYMGLSVPPGASKAGDKVGGGDSVLQASYQALRAMGVTYSNVESILDDFVTTTMSIKGLQGMIASGREKQILTRLQIMDMAKSIINMNLLDENETFTKVTSSVAGLADLIDRAAERASGVSNMPNRILMGKQIGGLNNDGSAETRDWYDYISALQEDYLQPCLEWLVTLVMACREGPTKGKEIEGWAIVFNPLWQLSDKEIADIHYTQAQADSLYIGDGVLQPAEVTISRFGQDEYSLETVLLADRVKPGDAPPPPPEPGDTE